MADGMPYPDGSFEVLLLIEVISHVVTDDVTGFFREMVRVFSIGGHDGCEPAVKSRGARMGVDVRDCGLLRRAASAPLPSRGHEWDDPAPGPDDERVWVAPLADWFRGPLREPMMDRLHGHRLEDLGLDPVAMRSVWTSFLAGQLHRPELLWSRWTLASWAEMWTPPP